MAPVHVLDPFYLGITLLITVAYQLFGFTIAWTCQFDKITDFTGGSNFFILGKLTIVSYRLERPLLTFALTALLTLLLGNTFHARNVVVSIFVMVWATRIAGFLLLRVLRAGSDSRFDDIRSHFFKFAGFWTVQILWVWTVSLPLIILNSPAVSDTAHGGSNPSFGTASDIVGIIFWVIGFIIESLADAQKFRYRFSKSRPKDRPMSAGLWGWSRHPPYFGEIMCWWGIWILCLSPTANGRLSSSRRAAQYGAVVSPIFTVLILMFGSGIPTAEKPQAKKYYLLSYGPNAQEAHVGAWNNYQRYLYQTSVLIPFPPAVYKHLPMLIKRWMLLDFPMYQFDEDSDGPAVIEAARQQLGSS